MSQKNCRFYNTSNGCRFGENCKFSHVEQNGNNKNRNNNRRNNNDKNNNNNNKKKRNEENLTKFVDTHCHFDLMMEKFRFGNNFDRLLDKINNYTSLLEFFICSFNDPVAFSSFGMYEEILTIDNAYATFGLHPHTSQNLTDQLLTKIENCLSHPKCVAYGEIGLDFHYNHSPPDVQMEVFRTQLEKAVELDKPIVIHSRKAADETYDILKDTIPKDWYFHLHSYSDDVDQANRIIDEFPNAYFGITGMVTFASASELRNAVKAIPLDRLLLETDAPYMTPNNSSSSNNNNRRKKQICHSGHCIDIAEKIAELKNITLGEVLEQVRENTKNIYKI
eukprot:TRINITY_DN325_c1_g1_i1.p1 TRINITY_DN325_c1_g1~~TRINITY_DN325_c1_g1_i1.p1  ORF type:complete len:335 (-),score=115.77 TRINITY_DN325_c1_g1_i1:101-1105(-)